MEENLLDCMNCRTPVKSSEAKAFAGVFVCPLCFSLAERTYNRGEAELKRMLFMLKETVRIALVQGKLSFAEGQDIEPTKSQVLQAIMQMQDNKS